MKTLAILSLSICGFIQVTLGQNKENNSLEKLEKSKAVKQLTLIDTANLKLSKSVSDIVFPNISEIQGSTTYVGPINIPNAYPKMLASGKDNSVILRKKMDVIHQAPMPGTESAVPNLHKNDSLNQLNLLKSIQIRK